MHRHRLQKFARFREKTEQSHCQLCPIRQFNKKWSDSLKEQKEAQDAEAAAKKAEAERKAAKEKQPKKDAEQITEGIKSKENASQATTATQKQKKK